PVPGPYEQRLALGINMLGAPNATLEMTNLDLSANGLAVNSNYAGADLAAFIVNNNDSQALGGGQQGQGAGQFLQIISQPALVTHYNGGTGSSSVQSSAVEAQFSQALGVPFSTIFSLPTGQGGSATIYAPTPELSNYDAMTRLLKLLPAQSFSNLINPSNIQNMKYFAALGVVPLNINGTMITGLSFYMHVQFPRQYYKGGFHQLDLKTLLGFQNPIIADTGANVSLISISFQPGTVLYSPQNPPRLVYDNSTSTFYYDPAFGSQPDFNANFTYPFAPDIVIDKRITPSSGPVGTTHVVTVTVENKDNVTVSNLSASDPQAPAQYLQTLQISPSGTQTAQSVILAPGNSMTMSYTATTESSGVYVLSPSTVSFSWTAPNGTQIRYSAITDPSQILSLSGPLIQFTRSFTDFQPYSYLLLVPLLLTPVIETYRLFRRRGQRKREKAILALSAPPSPPQPNIPKPPDSANAAGSPPAS
ncbi:MAG TPA: hypothetical protein VFJ63_04635, partial [Candidatus Bathyarchaeia archaeon]|nr:hypothetical protein [Candidatus Bathyarchaeia archaeon]